MAPTKYSTKTNEEIKKIVNDLIKAIRKSTKEQSANDASEVKVEVFQIGHGIRPFGNHTEGSYIDFTIEIKDVYNVPTFKVEGLGRQDLNKVADHLRTDVKGYDVEDGDLFFYYGNFTPDMTLGVLMDARSGDNINLHGSGHMLATYYNKGRIGHTFTAYNPYTCNEYITLIKSYGRKPIECMVSRERYGTELSVTSKVGK